MLNLYREPGESIKIYDKFGNWMGTIKVTESTSDGVHIGCIAPKYTKFLRGEVELMKGVEGQYSSAIDPYGNWAERLKKGQTAEEAEMEVMREAIDAMPDGREYAIRAPYEPAKVVVKS